MGFSRIDSIETYPSVLRSFHPPEKSKEQLGKSKGTGVTPLHIASANGQAEIVRLLLRCVGDAHPQTAFGVTPLHLACEKGHLLVTKILLKHSANIHHTQKNGFTPLHLACLNGHVELVQILLEHSNSVDIETPLWLAYKRGHLRVVEILLNHYADKDKHKSDGITPLHLASANGHEAIAKILIKHDADTEKVDCNGFTPLHLACKYGKLQVAEILLNHGATVDKESPKGMTPLHFACERGHAELANILLDHRADKNKQTSDGVTPLFFACWNNHSEAVELLLAIGADQHIHTKMGVTPLHQASENGYVKIVQILLKHGADINRMTPTGHTALHVASEFNHSETVKALLNRGAEKEIRCIYGWTPLHSSCFRGSVQTAEILLDYKVSNVDIKDAHGHTPLHLACSNGHLDVTDLLLRRGANRDITTELGETSLEIACKNGHAEVVHRLLPNRDDDAKRRKLLHLASSGEYFVSECFPRSGSCVGNHGDVVRLLLDRGGNVNEENENGDTPLHCASAAGRAELVRLLIERNADVLKSNDDGDTALHLACGNRHSEVSAPLPDTEGGSEYSEACVNDRVRIVSLLLEHGSNLDATNKKGNTPFHEACSSGYLKVAKCLLDNKASAKICNTDGETLSSLAAQEQHEDVAQLLLSHGGIPEPQDIFSHDDTAVVVNTDTRQGLHHPEKPANDSRHGPSFCRHWHFRKTFLSGGGRLQGKHSDVVLTIPENAIKVSDIVSVTGAVSMDLRRAHDALGLPENENLISPVVEYSSGQKYEFQTPVKISIPHFLPKIFCHDKVRVYKFKRKESGGFICQELIQQQPDDCDETYSGVFQISESRSLNVWISHFCAVACTYCRRIPPHLVLKLYGKHKQHDTKDVELCLLIWDNRLLCKDSSFGILPNEDQWIKFTPKTLDNVPDLSKVNLLLSPVVDKEKTWVHRKIGNKQCWDSEQVINLSKFRPCCPDTPAKFVAWALHNAPDTDPEVFRCVIEAGYVIAANGPREIFEDLPKTTLLATLDTRTKAAVPCGDPAIQINMNQTNTDRHDEHNTNSKNVSVSS